MDSRKRKALAALVAAPTVAEAAKASGISERTIYRYLSDPQFSAAYRDALDELVRNAGDQLKRAGPQAVAALLDVAGNAEGPPHARVSAAKALLDQLARLDQHADEAGERNVPTFVFDRQQEV